jgi:hypothetical protein
MPNGRFFGVARVIAALIVVGVAPTVSLGDDPTTGPKPAVPEGCKLVEGDILVPIGDDKTTYATYATNLWTNDIIPYEFDANVVPGLRGVANPQAAMWLAMDAWEAVANVEFRPRNGEGNYLHIQNSTANNSWVGMTGGQQVVNIFNWEVTFVMAHELGHALAFWHEQQRTDRDNFVRIELQNVLDPFEFAFQIEGASDNYGPYDFDSVMHYGSCSFTCCDLAQNSCGNGCSGTNAACRTITVLPPNQAWQDGVAPDIGQQTHLSVWDRLVMSFLYRQPDWWFVDRTYTGFFENGTFPEPDKTFARGMSRVPAGGTLWLLNPGDSSGYAAGGVWTKAVTIRAPLGAVLR